MLRHLLRGKALPALLLSSLTLIVAHAASLAAVPRAVSVETTSPPSAPLVVRGLGSSTVPLDGEWQFHLGDNPTWASPSVDDSGWERITAEKPWGAQGHEGYVGFAWYRRHIRFESRAQDGPATSSDFDLLFGNIDDAYEVYWNGALVGHDGSLPPHPHWYWSTQPRLTTVHIDGRRDGVLGLRVWKATLSSRETGYGGGFESMPVLGAPAAIADHRAAADLQWTDSRLKCYLVVYPLYALVAVLALLGWFRNRDEWLLFWVACFAIAPPLEVLLNNTRTPLPRPLTLGLLIPVNGISDISLWFLLIWLLQLRDMPRLMRAARSLALVLLTVDALDGLLAAFLWASPWALTTQVLDAVLTAIILLVEPFLFVLVAAAVMRRIGIDRERWLVAGAACLSQVVYTLTLAAEQGVRFTHWTLGATLRKPMFTVWGAYISAQYMADIVLLVSMVYAVYRYSIMQRDRQSVLEQEYKSARELQRVLIPETLPALDGFAVTSAYLPAQQVGGDFFQLIERQTAPGDRSAILVLGDVSGKGLKAAMTVSLIVGAVRTLVETTEDPSEILAGLNRRLIGRLDYGFATCIALRFDADGNFVVANAGHPAPFLNANEMQLPGALPLGLDPDEVYENVTFAVNVGDRLTFYTDGLLEARNAAGEIFSFERLQALIATVPDAKEATDAAVAFGQDDDITVLTLTRLAIGVASTTSLITPELARARS